VAGTDGIFAIEGVPAECDSALLYAGTDSLAIALPEKETRLDWAIGVQRTTGLRPARARQAGQARSAWRARPVGRADRKGAYDLAGRKFNAGRARSRP
jgi:hypothetical protein